MQTKLRFGVIGWGYWGPKIARNLDMLPDAVVKIVADENVDRLKSVMNLADVIVTTRAEDIFRSDVDGVVIATPVRSHYQLAKAALQHNKHVLVEKPLTNNVALAEELVALAEERQRILMVGHTFLYNPAVIKLRELIQSGTLGKICYIESERLNLGRFRNDVDVIWDLAPHDVSILLYLLGKQPTRIAAQAHALQWHLHETAHLDLEFVDGMTAHIHVSWLHPCKIRQMTVIGDLKMAVYDDTSSTEMVKVYDTGADIYTDPVVGGRQGEVTVPHIDWVEPLRLECEDFADSIRQGKQPRADGRSGLEVVQILAATQGTLEKQEILAAAQGTLEKQERLKTAVLM